MATLQQQIAEKFLKQFAESPEVAVNKRRALLGLPEIAELTSDTKFDDGLTSSASGQEFHKQSALRDLNAASAAISALGTQAATEAAAIVADIEKLQADPTLLIAVQRRTFVEKGLELVDGPECPLCDHAWESEAGLRAHLAEKLSKSKEAQDIQRALMANAGAVTEAVLRLGSTITGVQRLAAAQGETSFVQLLATWKIDLDTLRGSLGTLA